MLANRSLKLPITIGVTMIVLLVTLIVGWVIVTAFGAISETGNAPLYWTLLFAGIVFLAVVLLGVIFYLTLAIKAINLSRRQSNFIDSVTHELKSPIASLKLCLQTLSRLQVDEQKRASFHHIMLDDVERLDQLISHLLEVGGLDKEPNENEAEWVNLESLLQQCAEAVCGAHQLDQSVVAVAVPDCEIHARKMDLEVIFRNLIDNAVKYGGKPLKVSISGDYDEGYIVITVLDNGPGIPHEQRRRIFRRFIRLGSELEREQPGTGLGLYLVRTLVRRLKGKVRVKDHEGGALFELRLPAQLIPDRSSARNLKKPRELPSKPVASS